MAPGVVGVSDIISGAGPDDKEEDARSGKAVSSLTSEAASGSSAVSRPSVASTADMRTCLQPMRSVEGNVHSELADKITLSFLPEAVSMALAAGGKSSKRKGLHY